MSREFFEGLCTVMFLCTVSLVALSLLGAPLWAVTIANCGIALAYPTARRRA